MFRYSNLIQLIIGFENSIQIRLNQIGCQIQFRSDSDRIEYRYNLILHCHSIFVHFSLFERWFYQFVNATLNTFLVANTFLYHTFQYVKIKRYYDRTTQSHSRGKQMNSSSIVGRKGKEI